jgi:hypothetical protein
MRQLAKELFTYTQANWIVTLEHLIQTGGVAAASFLLNLVSFCQLTGQLLLLKHLVQQVVDSLRISEAEEALAPCLGTLGNVLSDLGERDAARTAFTEALEIYWPLFTQWPQAFGPNCLVVLRNYVNLTGENADDPWWQRWQQFQADPDVESGERT